MQIVNNERLQPNEKKLSKEGQEEADVEPSMEDILASIRRILSEEEKEAAIEENLEPKEAADAELQPEETLGDEPDKEMDVVPDMEADELENEPDMAATVETDDSKPNIDSEVESMETEPETELENEPSQANSEPDTQYKDDDVLELTEAMIAPADSLMSGKTTELSSDVLSELARAIMDRREMGIGDKDVTLEGMVREMLRPILREWLDRNLPHLIERLVKKEIDKMVNRAEMFKDL